MNQTSELVSESVRQSLERVVGAKNLLTTASEIDVYVNDRDGMFPGRADLVLRPQSTVEVAQIVKICGSAGLPLVPQGGNTGFVGGSSIMAGVLVNLGRLNKVREVDVANFTMTAEAGCILADLQEAAEAQDRLFPLSLGAQGSCMIGGNLSTNAGGVGVLRYGNARELALGLEVVLPNGEIWDGLRALRKDNTGYDLKQLFIGAEGTLGIITAATLKLFPLPVSWHTSLVGIDDIGQALEIFGLMRHAGGDMLTAFELMPQLGVDLCLAHGAGAVNPLSGSYPYYLLIELSDQSSEGTAGAAFEAGLAQALEKGWARDVVIAQSNEQRQNLWHLRHTLPESFPDAGAVIGNDISVPVSRVPDLIRQGSDAVEAACPGIRPLPFGHIGDGNIHFNLLQPEGADPKTFSARRDELAGLIADIAFDLNGSFSAEHGIGRLKRDQLVAWKSTVEIALMRQLKQAIDPQNLMNPGKIFLDGT
ncbi:MAG: FAD-binding oxidoreductase [Alphaproteobacteria bacterium]|nr:FAD-binding oxidoreductase [Alphaproteobacteria bacterium]